MSTTKLNSANLTEQRTSAKGVLLVYTASNGTQTAQLFSGEDYEPKSKKANDIFKAWKNIVKTFWAVKIKELELREANDGIRTKLRASIPTEIIFNCTNGDTKMFHLEASVWARIGLIPTKKDLERLESNNDKKAAIHNATKASFDALGFRVALTNDDEKPAGETDKILEKVSSEVGKEDKTKKKETVTEAAAA